MGRRLNWNRVRERLCQPLDELTPHEASELVLELGTLAGWCLRPEVIARARDDDTVSGSVRRAWKAADQVPMEDGGCWVAFAADEELTLLRPAFVVPLRWREGDGHSDCLPRSLRDLADRVLADFATEKSVAGKSWGLEPATVLRRSDFSEVELQCDSGWASLAAGLLAAAEGGKVDHGVWATARWDNGIGPVGSLPAKIELAAEYGARWLFVPEQQEDEARSIVADQKYQLKIGRLTQGETQGRKNPRAALRAYLTALKVRPSRSDPREIRAAYYLSPDLDDTAAREFYRDNLMPDIVTDCRGYLASGGPRCVAALITLASDNSELVALGIEALQPLQCLVLYTADYAERTATARDLATNNTVGCQVREKAFPTLENLRAGMADAIQEFLRGFAAAEVVFDLTPGPKDISFAWMLDIAPFQSRLYYLRHTIAEKVRRVVPFSERPQMWSAGEGVKQRQTP